VIINGKREGLVLFVALLLIDCFYLLGVWVYPYFEDTGLYATIANRILSGSILYQDVFDHKTPGIYILEICRIILFGNSSFSARWFEIMFVIALQIYMVIVCLRDGASFSKKALAIAALGLIGFLYSGVFWGLPERGQIEIYQSIFVCFSFLFFYLDMKGGEGWRLSFGVGIMVGVVVWLKPTYFPLIFVYVLGYALFDRGEGKRLLGYLFGAGLVSLIVLLFLLFFSNINDFVWLLTKHYSAYLGGGQSYLENIKRLWLMFVHIPPYRIIGFLLLCSFMIAVFDILRNRYSLLYLICFFVFLCAVHAFGVSGYGFYYHAIPVICTSFVIIYTCALRAFSLDRGLGFIFSGMIFIVCFWGAASSERFKEDFFMASRIIRGEYSLEDAYKISGKEMHYYDFADEQEAGKYLNDYFEGRQYSFYIIGLGSVTYLEARGDNASRHLVTIFGQLPGYEFADMVMGEILSDLSRKRPDAILVRINDRFPWFGVPKSSYDRAHENKQLLSLLDSNYIYLGGLNNSYVVYMKKL
jgi:hypothetical protein